MEKHKDNKLDIFYQYNKDCHTDVLSSEINKSSLFKFSKIDNSCIDNNGNILDISIRKKNNINIPINNEFKFNVILESDNIKRRKYSLIESSSNSNKNKYSHDVYETNNINTLNSKIFTENKKLLEHTSINIEPNNNYLYSINDINSSNFIIKKNSICNEDKSSNITSQNNINNLTNGIDLNYTDSNKLDLNISDNYKLNKKQAYINFSFFNNNNNKRKIFKYSNLQNKNINKISCLIRKKYSSLIKETIINNKYNLFSNIFKLYNFKQKINSFRNIFKIISIIIGNFYSSFVSLAAIIAYIIETYYNNDINYRLNNPLQDINKNNNKTVLNRLQKVELIISILILIEWIYCFIIIAKSNHKFNVKNYIISKRNISASHSYFSSYNKTNVINNYYLNNKFKFNCKNVFNKKYNYSRIKNYIFDYLNILDLISIIPPFIELMANTTIQNLNFLRVFKILRVMRIFRIYKLIRNPKLLHKIEDGKSEQLRRVVTAFIALFSMVFLFTGFVHSLNDIFPLIFGFNFPDKNKIICINNSILNNSTNNLISNFTYTMDIINYNNSSDVIECYKNIEFNNLSINEQYYCPEGYSLYNIQKKLEFDKIFYFLVTTTTTVGYGEIFPTNYTRYIIIVYIIASMVTLSRITNDINTLFKSDIKYYLKKSFKNHIIITGFYTKNSLLSFLNEFFHTDHIQKYNSSFSSNRYVIIINNHPPNIDIQSIIINPKFNYKVFYICGDILSDETLKLANFDYADSIFLLNTIEDDYVSCYYFDNLKKLRLNKNIESSSNEINDNNSFIREFAFNNNYSNNINELYQNNSSDYINEQKDKFILLATKYLNEASLYSKAKIHSQFILSNSLFHTWADWDIALSILQTKMSIIVINGFINGFSTMIMNMISSSKLFISKEIKEKPWMLEYMHGASQEIYLIKIPEEFLIKISVELKFYVFVQFVYIQYNILIIGLKRQKNYNDELSYSLYLINPLIDCILSTDELIVIAIDKDRASNIFNVNLLRKFLNYKKYWDIKNISSKNIYNYNRFNTQDFNKFRINSNNFDNLNNNKSNNITNVKDIDLIDNDNLSKDKRKIYVKGKTVFNNTTNNLNVHKINSKPSNYSLVSKKPILKKNTYANLTLNRQNSLVSNINNFEDCCYIKNSVNLINDSNRLVDNTNKCSNCNEDYKYDNKSYFTINKNLKINNEFSSSSSDKSKHNLKNNVFLKSKTFNNNNNNLNYNSSKKLNKQINSYNLKNKPVVDECIFNSFKYEFVSSTFNNMSHMVLNKQHISKSNSIKKNDNVDYYNKITNNKLIIKNSEKIYSEKITSNNLILPKEELYIDNTLLEEKPDEFIRRCEKTKPQKIIKDSCKTITNVNNKEFNAYNSINTNKDNNNSYTGFIECVKTNIKKEKSKCNVPYIFQKKRYYKINEINIYNLKKYFINHYILFCKEEFIWDFMTYFYLNNYSVIFYVSENPPSIKWDKITRYFNNIVYIECAYSENQDIYMLNLDKSKHVFILSNTIEASNVKDSGILPLINFIEDNFPRCRYTLELNEETNVRYLKDIDIDDNEDIVYYKSYNKLRNSKLSKLNNIKYSRQVIGSKLISYSKSDSKKNSSKNKYKKLKNNNINNNESIKRESSAIHNKINLNNNNKNEHKPYKKFNKIKTYFSLGTNDYNNNNELKNNKRNNLIKRNKKTIIPIRLWPKFANSQLFFSSSIDSLLAFNYHNQGILEVLEKLLGIEEPYIDENIAENNNIVMFRLVGTERYTYDQVFNLFITLDTPIIPIAVYRNSLDKILKNSLPFIITNPKKDLILNIEDKIICIGNPDKNVFEDYISYNQRKKEENSFSQTSSNYKLTDESKYNSDNSEDKITSNISKFNLLNI